MLINSLAELKEYLPASVLLAWADIEPKVRMVERDIIRKQFSKAIYDHVQALDAGEQAQELRELLSEATAHLALLHYIGFGQVHITSSGIQIESNQNLKTAFEWQITDLRRECSLQGWNAIESALEIMETLTEGDLLDLWKLTPAYLASRSALIPSLREFQKYVHLGDSRVLFNKLLPTLTEQQESRFQLALGPAMWLRLGDYDNPDVDASIRIRIAHVRKMCARALAYATIGEGFVNTMLVLTDNGPMVIDGMQSRLTEAKKTAPEEFVAAIAAQYAAKASGAITAIFAYLQQNVAHFPEYKDSDNYIDDDTIDDHLFRNDPDWGIVFFQ